jgi:hypothetical protein
MSTRQEDPRPADASKAGPDQDPADAASDRGVTAAAKVRAWLAHRIPDDWFAIPPDIQVDREEITIIGTLTAPAGAPGNPEDSANPANPRNPRDPGNPRNPANPGNPEDSANPRNPRNPGDPGDPGSAEQAAAAAHQIRRFREESRSRRIEIAREAEHRFGRKVSWGVVCGPVSEMFTTLSVPVMTRLRQSERRVLDTLVDAGVARSRSDALAWCVRLTGENADEWLSRLRDALRHVEEVRDQGP